MSLREKLNKNSQMMTIAFIVIIVAALWFIMGSGKTESHSYGRKVFLTEDDGKTYFVGDRNAVVPYMKDGKEVVRAHVFKCPSKGTFVGFLQRFSKESIAEIEEAKAAVAAGKKPKNLGAFSSAESEGSEYKLPGAGNPWKRGLSGDVVSGSAAAICDSKPNEFADAVIP